jgi:hypothetical protein
MIKKTRKAFWYNVWALVSRDTIEQTLENCTFTSFSKNKVQDHIMNEMPRDVWNHVYEQMAEDYDT